MNIKEVYNLKKIIIYYIVILIVSTSNVKIFILMVTNMSKLIDNIVNGIYFEEIIDLSKNIFILNLIYMGTVLSLKNLIEYQTGIYEKELFKNIFNRIYLYRSINKLKNNKGEIIEIVQKDINIVNTFHVNIIPNAIYNVFFVIFISYNLIQLDIFIFIITSILIIVNTILRKIISSKQKKIFKQLQRLLSDFNNRLISSISNVEVIRIFDKKKSIISNVNQIYVRFVQSKNNKNYLSNLNYSINFFLSISMIIVVYILGGKNISQGTMTIGSLVMYSTYLNRMNQPISYLLDMIEKSNYYSASKERILKKFNESELILNNGEKIEHINDIKLIDLSLKYDDINVVKSNNLSIYKGEKVLLMGENGSGKTSLIKCILNQNHNYFGKILINDINIKNINIFSYWDNISYVDQITNIIEDIDKNIFNSSDDLITRENNSGGEKQIVSIIRSLKKKADLYIFDEVTNNLDSEAIKDVEKAINNISDATVIIISHKMLKISFDKILKIDKGEIYEFGENQNICN